MADDVGAPGVAAGEARGQATTDGARHPKKDGLVRAGERLDPRNGFEFVKVYRVRLPIRAIRRVPSFLPRSLLRLVEVSAVEAGFPGRSFPGVDRAGLAREPESHS